MNTINLKRFFLFLTFFMGVGLCPHAQESTPIIEGNVLRSWPGASGEIKIPDGVTEIAPQAFYTPGEDDPDGWGSSNPVSNIDIRSIDFNQVVSIGNEAFKGCTGIQKMNAPMLKRIGKNAFEGCDALTSLSLPVIEQIGNDAFAHCSSLASISFGQQLSDIGDANPFKNCVSLSSVALSAECQKFFVEQNALVEGATGTLRIGSQQADLTFSDKVKCIGKGAFYNCDKVTSLSAPGCISVGEQAFGNCLKLSELYLPHLESVSDDWLTFYQVKLLLLDIHESPSIPTFHGNLADLENLKIYVATEAVKQALAKEFTKAQIIVGSPSQEVVKHRVTFHYDTSKGKVEAWRTGAIDVVSGEQVPHGVKVSFKALPRFGIKVAKWLVNGTDVSDRAENEEKTLFSIDNLDKDIDVEVVFEEEAKGDVVYYDSMSPSFGTVSCSLEDGTMVKSAGTVPPRSQLHFVATPMKGYRVTEWKLRESSIENGKMVTKDTPIPEAYGKTDYLCTSKDGLHIIVDFNKQENSYTVEYASLNEYATLTAKLSTGELIQNREAVPAGKKIIFEATPVSDNIVVDDWMVNDKIVSGAKDFIYTIESLSEDVVVSVICKEKTEEKVPEGAIIKDGVLVKWTPEGEAVLPESVNEIADRAFEGANGMTKLTLNNTVSKIGSLPFLYCTDLKEIVAPATNNSFTSVDGVLYNKDKTCLIAYPSGREETHYELIVTAQRIQYGALSACPNLLDVSVATGNQSLRVLDGALCTADGAELLYYPTGFRTDHKGESISLPRGIKTLAPYAIAYAPMLESVKIPVSVEAIGDNCFAYCPKLEGIQIDGDTPPSLRRIGNEAFYYCRLLKSFPYYMALREIGNKAFAICDEMTEIHIPAECAIAADALQKCRGLKSVYAHALHPNLIDANLFKDILFIDEATLYVPVGTSKSYSEAVGWNVFHHIIEDPMLTAIADLTDSNLCIARDATGYAISGLPTEAQYAVFSPDGQCQDRGIVRDGRLQIRFPEGTSVIVKVDGVKAISLSR